ncbi:glycosyltransferase family protein [Actinomyces vulturis]|uniref:glycosyltransferase family protein n=1 Tax=Actinomyces vulturis TaxID=1857645 RepID=UPI00082D7629|nr:glycosyltransferase [Actinomyces vulturis]
MISPTSNTSQQSRAEDTRPWVVFHAPYPLEPGKPAASKLRPVAMRKAFRELGYDVVDVTGYAPARRRAIHRVMKRIVSGDHPVCVYGENATIPSALTEPRHVPVHPRLDMAFFRFCTRQGIPVGVFYRDIYWRFPRFRTHIPRPIELGLQIAYRSELLGYRYAGVHLFVPSEPMIPYIPFILHQYMSPLPPGSDSGVDITSSPSTSHVTFLFIGVLGDNYRLDEAFHAINHHDDAKLTLCVREETWQEWQSHYAPMISAEKLRVVHVSGADLEPLYRDATVGLLLTQPHEYWDFAVPYKLYEYLAHQLPIVATQGTQTGRIVDDLGIGWTIENTESALMNLIDHLTAHPEQIEAVRSRMREVLSSQTWAARARTVIDVLTGETE